MLVGIISILKLKFKFKINKIVHSTDKILIVKRKIITASCWSRCDPG